MSELYNGSICVTLLIEKQRELHARGEMRYPRRSDFSEAEAREVVAIKAFLGPWPRALERAGLKAPREDGHAVRVVEKRIAQKRRRTAEKIRLAKEKKENKSCVRGEKKI